MVLKVEEPLEVSAGGEEGQRTLSCLLPYAVYLHPEVQGIIGRASGAHPPLTWRFAGSTRVGSVAWLPGFES
jgi:hypothetical protein